MREAAGQRGGPSSWSTLGGSPPPSPGGKEKGFQTQLQQWERQLFSLSPLVFCFSNWDNLGLLAVFPQAEEPVCHAPHHIQDTPKDTPLHTLTPSCISHPAPSQGRWKTGRAPRRAQQGQGERFYGLKVSQCHAQPCPGAAGSCWGCPRQSSGSCPCSPSTLPSPFCCRDVNQADPTGVVPQTVSGTPEGSGS